jgi:hypothetical protein
MLLLSVMVPFARSGNFSPTASFEAATFDVEASTVAKTGGHPACRRSPRMPMAAGHEFGRRGQHSDY